MEEWLLLDRIALNSANVAPGNVEFPASVEANFTHAGLAIGNRAAVSAGKAAQPVVIEFLNQAGISLANVIVQNFAEGAHDFILRPGKRLVCNGDDSLRSVMLPEPIVHLLLGRDDLLTRHL